MSEFHHVSHAGEGRTLLVLHGTGGDERSLVDLARYVAPNAPILSPRGTSLEEGVPRFFRRLREGVLDQEDMRAKTADLAAFLRARGGPFDVLGYSNGANMGLSLLFREPELVGDLVLFRPMVVFEPDPALDLSDRRALILAGRNDPLVSTAETERLAAQLRIQGVETEIAWTTTGHQLSRPEIDLAKEWRGES